MLVNVCICALCMCYCLEDESYELFDLLFRCCTLGTPIRTPLGRWELCLLQVPVLETPDGPVFESNAIARYVTRLKADNPLYGSSLIEYVSGISGRGTQTQGKESS
ncbi:uncharacterized protein LOC133744398 [Rosa rugosa]|uniref:uncharacterized protein LOC133744398 n=1 Tax=Rosa rugosa TaxID=74645 RepID=UPI002B405C82|nr:uncharacterized protein LOC133744398 [Rosa rugosa]